MSWRVPRLAGSKATAGPFVVTVGVFGLTRGTFEVRSWITVVDRGEDFDEAMAAALRPSVRLHKP